MYAHYFGTTKLNRKLVISETNRPTGKEFKVSGKVEARKLAKQFNAKPWNF